MYAWNDLCGSREIGVKSQAMCTATGFFPLLPRMGAPVLVTDGGATCGERAGRNALAAVEDLSFSSVQPVRLVWIPRNRSKTTSDVYRSGRLPAAPPHGCLCPCHGRRCYLQGVDTDCMIMSLQAVKGRMMPAAGLRFLCCVSHDIESATIRATIPRKTGGRQPNWKMQSS